MNHADTESIDLTTDQTNMKADLTCKKQLYNILEKHSEGAR